MDFLSNQGPLFKNAPEAKGKSAGGGSREGGGRNDQTCGLWRNGQPETHFLESAGGPGLQSEVICPTHSIKHAGWALEALLVQVLNVRMIFSETMANGKS